MNWKVFNEVEKVHCSWKDNGSGKGSLQLEKEQGSLEEMDSLSRKINGLGDCKTLAFQL